MENQYSQQKFSQNVQQQPPAQQQTYNQTSMPNNNNSYIQNNSWNVPVGKTLNKHGQVISRPSINVNSEDMFKEKPRMYQQSFHGEWKNTMDLLKLKESGEDKSKFLETSGKL